MLDISLSLSRSQGVRRNSSEEEMVSLWSLVGYGVGGVIVAGVALLVAFQEKLVYVPVLPGLAKAYAVTPARLRLAYEDVWLRSSDGVRLHSWFIKLSPNCTGDLSLFLSLSLYLRFIGCEIRVFNCVI